MSNIQWEGKFFPVSDSQVREVEKELDVKFPEDYVEIVKIYGGGHPVPNSFDFVDPEMNMLIGSCLGSLFSFDPALERGITKVAFNPPEFFPMGLIAIGEDGGGDLICFDYRNPGSLDVPVVYWSHEAFNEDTAITFLAPNFTNFLDLLRPMKSIDI